MLLVKLVIISVLTLLMSLFFHELGHYLYFSHVLKKKVRFFFKKGIIVGSDDDYKGLSNKQYMSLLSWGVLGGLLLLFFMIILTQLELLIFMLIPYVACCVTDIKNIYLSYIDQKQALLVDEPVDKLIGFRRLFK